MTEGEGEDEVNGGILPPYEIFYIHSMLVNTASAMQSIKLLADTFDKVAGEAGEDALAGLDDKVILNNLQNIIVQGAAISRYFWPARKGYEPRACALRAALDVTDDSPLRDRELRNALEHFDEKLDDYLSGGIVGYVLPQYVGPQLKDVGVPGHLFRAYFFDVGKFELLGKQYDVEPIANEIARVHDILEHCMHTGGRLPQPKMGSRPSGDAPASAKD